MKQRYRIISLLLCAAMLFGILPSLALGAQAYSSTDVEYAVTGGYIYFNKSTGEITDCDENVTSAVIPTEISGVTVTTIGDSAFCECDSLTSIEIPDSVTSIGDSAFEYCRSLTSITIGDSVTSIGDSAFEYCCLLTSIEIPDSVTSIGDSAFSDCLSLTSIEIPDSVTTISDSAFNSCDSLTSITIPDSVTSIGTSAFFHCLSLTSIEIPDSVTSISAYAFAYCNSLTSITIPDSVTSIYPYAFAYCDNLAHVLYCGTQAQWNDCKIGTDNSNLTSATRHDNASGEEVFWKAVDGGKQLYCSLCDKLIGDKIACTHEMTVLNKKEPTETEHGYTGDVWCTKCELMITEGSVWHNFDTNGKCTVCGEQMQFVIEMSDSSGDGWNGDSICVYAGETLIKELTVRSGASAVATIDYYACTDYRFVWKKGSDASECSFVIKLGDETLYECKYADSLTEGEFLTVQTAHGWDEGTVTTEPTCMDDGIKTYTCKVCGENRAETVAALGHNWGEGTVTTEPTCYENGEMLHICTLCGETKTQTVASPGHITDADGNCTVCGLGDPLVIVMNDSYGDGWNGNQLLVYENDVLIKTLTLTDGSSATESIEYYTCNTYRIEWKRGYSTGECSFRITKGGKTLYEIGAANSLTNGATLVSLDGAHRWQEATCQTPKTCELCALTEGEPLEHTFVNGVCICGATENTEPQLDANLKFNMDISAGAEMVVNYNFMASLVSKYTDFYLEVSKNVAGGEPIVTTYGIGGEHTAIGQMPATGTPIMYNAAYTGINAKEMGDSFATTLYAIDANGKVYRGETVVSSIKDFLIGKLEDSASIPEMKTMAVDMLKYGAAAQVNFGYDTENLVTDALTEDQLALGTQEIPEATDMSSVSGSGVNINTSITVKSKVELTLSCIAAGQANPAAVKCIITDEDGTVLAELATLNTAGVMYSAKYDNVGAKEMRKVITATFYNEAGTAISKTVRWSVESYVAQTRAKTNATETEIAMVNAMLTYGDSVAAYMAAK